MEYDESQLSNLVTEAKAKYVEIETEYNSLKELRGKLMQAKNAEELEKDVIHSFLTELSI